jgi:hypothetical protein
VIWSRVCTCASPESSTSRDFTASAAACALSRHSSWDITMETSHSATPIALQIRVWGSGLKELRVFLDIPEPGPVLNRNAELGFRV